MSEQEKMVIRVRPADSADLSVLAMINLECFRGNRGDLAGKESAARAWLKIRLQQYPMYHLFAAHAPDGSIAGYIGWELKGGFWHPAAPIELEQLAIGEEFQGRGVGTALIEHTIPRMLEHVRKENPHIADGVHLHVWFNDSNERARATYAKFFDPIERGERFIHGKREVCYMIKL